jgi:hypothetical protein
MKPTPIDIANAIAMIEAGVDRDGRPDPREREWIDPTEVTAHWDCRPYDPEGKAMGEGQAETAGEAMALAWIHAHAPDALIDAHVALGAVPYIVPDTWRFELTAGAWLMGYGEKVPLAWPSPHRHPFRSPFVSGRDTMGDGRRYRRTLR